MDHVDGVDTENFVDMAAAITVQTGKMNGQRCVVEPIPVVVLDCRHSVCSIGGVITAVNHAPNATATGAPSSEARIMAFAVAANATTERICGFLFKKRVGR